MIPNAVVISIFSRTTSRFEDPSSSFDNLLPRLFVDPVFVGEDELHKEGSPKAYYAHNGQPLKAGVLGCALAHRDALSLLLDSGYAWGVILEDDAIVEKPNRILELLVALEYLGDNQVPTVIQLAWSKEDEQLAVFDGPIANTRICNRTPMSTVAYLINTAAASLAIRRQSPVAYKADWPFLASEVQMILDFDEPVVHDPKLPSIVGARGRDSSPWPKYWRLRIMTYVWFFQHREHFIDVRHYTDLIIEPRLRRFKRALRFRSH